MLPCDTCARCVCECQCCLAIREQGACVNVSAALRYVSKCCLAIHEQGVYVNVSVLGGCCRCCHVARSTSKAGHAQQKKSSLDQAHCLSAHGNVEAFGCASHGTLTCYKCCRQPPCMLMLVEGGLMTPWWLPGPWMVLLVLPHLLPLWSDERNA
eukprot:1160153-Pelagomonas_calceolata.AAC.3